MGGGLAMRNAIKSIYLLAVGLLLIVPIFSGFREGAVSSAKTTPQRGQVEQCIGNGEIEASIATLRTYLAGPELAKAVGLLLRKARESQKCRAQVIEALIIAMSRITPKDPPLSTVGVNEQTYYLWRNGSDLFIKLQATEALDLLITNLALTDGWSISMSHYPAVAAVTGIGAPAIPKLEFVLHHNPQPHMRKFAVFCLSLIGGAPSRNVLSKALPTETDPCVNRLIRISLELFGKKAVPNSITPADDKWYSAFYCLPERV
jgi:hypothetical protein